MFDTEAKRHVSKYLRSLLQSSVSVPLTLYQKHVINDVQNFVLSINHLIGLVLVFVKEKKITLRKRYGSVSQTRSSGPQGVHVLVFASAPHIIQIIKA